MEAERRIILFLLVSLPISVWDLARLRIPGGLVAAGFLLAGANCLISPAWTPSAAAGAAAGFLLFWAVRRLVPNGMGAGDVKLAGLVGAMTGIGGLCVALVVASAGGLLVALVLALLTRREGRRRIPFAPFLTLGGAVSLLGSYFGWTLLSCAGAP